MNDRLLRRLGGASAVLALLASLLIATTASAAGGRDLYVSPSGSNTASGLSRAAAFQTLHHAFSQLQPGDTLWMGGGTYTESADVNNSGTASNWITIAALPGEKPILSLRDDNALKFNGSSYVELRGLELDGNQDGPDSEIGVGVLIYNGAHHIRVVGNTVHDFNAGGVVSVGGSSHLEIYHNTIYNNAWWNKDQHSGISLLGLVDVGGGNDANGYSNYIIGNLVYGNANKVHSRHNPGRETDGNCLVMDVTLESNYTGSTLIGSNICVSNGGRGFQAYRSNNVDVVNNTFYQNMQTPAVANIGSEIMAYESQNVQFFNNLVMSIAGVLPATHGATISDVQFSHNVYTGDRDPQQNNTDRHLSRGTQVVADPGQLTAAGFTPVSNSPALNHGSTNFPALTVDFAGNHRSVGGAPDAGAVERGSSTNPAWIWDDALAGPGAPPATAPPVTTAPVTTAPAPTAAPTTTQPAVTLTGAALEARQKQVNRLYRSVLRREPDIAGRDYWVGTGLNDYRLVDQFMDSPEFIDRFGRLSNAEFVTYLYEFLLQRQPDTAGFNYWVRTLRSEPRNKIVVGFLDSPEGAVRFP